MDENLQLPADVRAALPAPVQAYLAYQDAQIALLQEEVSKLEGELAKLRSQLAEALARIRQHSGNSYRPPSSDPPDAPPRPKHKPSEHRRGGQKGHPGHTRLQLAEADLSRVAEHRPVLDDPHFSTVPELGRRIEVAWQSRGLPPDGQLARVPRPANGAVVSRAAIRRLSDQEFKRFVSILGNPAMWERLP